MSFGFSLSDVVKGAEFCRWIIDHCFDKTNSADIRYKQLENDISGLESRLKLLYSTFDSGFPDKQPINDLKDVVGDFFQTLEECQDILQQRRFTGLKTNSAGFVQNVVWASTTQDKVDLLRRRIQFHTQKIFLIIEPVKLGLLTTISERMDEMTAMMRAHFPLPDPLDPIPSWLSSRFEETIMKNAPSGFTDLHKLPMREGFDLLYGHFRESTWAFRDPETADQTAEQYLNLLKAQWILETIKKGLDFKRARAGSLFKWTIAEIEQKIIVQYRRPDLVRFEDPELQKLGDSSFLIWQPEEVVQVKVLTDPSHGEEEILRLSLPTASSSKADYMVLFRIGHGIRIARYVVPDREGTSPYFENDNFNPHTDRFVPYYAIQESVPLATQRRASILPYNAGIYRGNNTGTTPYSVKEQKDMWEFQRAVTGYQVVFDMNATWLFHKAKISFRGVRLSGRSKIQIWHWKPLPAKLQQEKEEPDSQSSGTGSLKTVSSTTSTTVAEIILNGTDMANVALDNQSHAPNHSTLVATLPPPPVIMIFAKVGGHYRYVHLELTRGMEIISSACRCNTAPNECPRVVLQTGKAFPVREMSVNTDQLSDWNLSLFGHPRHPQLDSDNRVRLIKCKFLNIDFDSILEKDTFILRFRKAIKLRDDAATAINRIRRRAQELAEDARRIDDRREAD